MNRYLHEYMDMYFENDDPLVVLAGDRSIAMQQQQNPNNPNNDAVVAVRVASSAVVAS